MGNVLKVIGGAGTIATIHGLTKSAAGAESSGESGSIPPPPVRIWAWEVEAEFPPYGRLMKLTLTSAGYNNEEDVKLFAFLVNAMYGVGRSNPQVMELRLLSDEEAALAVDEDERRRTMEALYG